MRKVQSRWLRATMLAVFATGVYLYQNQQDQTRLQSADTALYHAVENQFSNQQVEGSGTVIRVLPDDNRGSRHQRFLLRLGHTRVILIAHNIDLAPAIDDLQKGDSVGFYGEFKWNDKGGVVHWTHHDPKGIHPNGWLEHGAQKYQ